MMSKAEREDALIELTVIRRSIAELADSGVDVTRLRSEAARLAAHIEAQGDAGLIEGWLRSMGEGQVISYRVQFPGNGMVYHFAAIKVGLVWYTTARSGSRQYSSGDLARWMAHQVNLVGCVRMRVAGSKDAYRSPEVEMGQR